MKSLVVIKHKVLKARKETLAAAKLFIEGKMKLEDFNAIRDKKILSEREYSLAKGWETAAKINWEPPWSIGAPMPYIIANEIKVFLIYLIQVDNPNWDGTSVNMIDHKSEQAQPLALVEFKKCYIHKFGGMNDEVWYGHPLFKRGLEGYSAHEIKNSKWLEEQRKINSVHSCHKEERWAQLKHFMLLFHDTVFECLAEGFEVNIYKDSFENVAKLAAQKLF